MNTLAMSNFFHIQISSLRNHLPIRSVDIYAQCREKEGKQRTPCLSGKATEPTVVDSSSLELILSFSPYSSYLLLLHVVYLNFPNLAQKNKIHFSRKLR